jgi:hypothetical protein
MVTVVTLSHLFCFWALSWVILVPPGGFDFDDAAIDAVACAWRDVREMNTTIVLQR